MPSLVSANPAIDSPAPARGLPRSPEREPEGCAGTLSRMTLGTVQFGLPYGVANSTGCPSFDSICALLRRAHEGGINVLDTAACYGESEQVLGRALAITGLRDAFHVVTKVEPLSPGLSSAEAARRIEASVTRSLAHLGLERLEICLFHREHNISYADELIALRDRGLIGAGGVSLVNPEFAKKALALPELTVWQVPSNLLDRRYTHSGLLASAKRQGTTIFARSVYLQGLLLMTDEATPDALREVEQPRRRLREIARAFDLPLAEFAVRAMLSRDDLDSVLVGVETVPQLEQNLAHFRKGPLPQPVLAALEAFEPAVSDILVNPTLWPQNK